MATQLAAPYGSSTSFSYSSSGWVTLSNGNLTATSSGGNSGRALVLATRVLTSMLSYFEFEAVTFGGTMSVGVASNAINASGGFGTYPGYDVYGCGFLSTGAVEINGSTIATIQSYAAGATIGVAVNIALGLIWFTTNGTTWNNAAIGSQNPAGNVGGISLATMNAGPMFPAAGATAAGAVFTAAFSSGSFAYTPPSGYASVDACGVAAARNAAVGASAGFPTIGGCMKAPATITAVARNSATPKSATFSTVGGCMEAPATTTAAARASNLGPGIGVPNGVTAYSPANTLQHVTGYTTELGQPVSVDVYAYDAVNGGFLGSALTSPVDGSFSIPVAGRTSVIVVARDATRNLVQVYQDVNPQ